MSKNVVVKKESFDFFTETVICFTIKSVEHKIKLAISGIFKTEENKIIPVPVKYKIVEVKKENKSIPPSLKITQFVNKWIKSNPNKFSSFISTELGIMIRLAASSSLKTSQLSKNTIDSK